MEHLIKYEIGSKMLLKDTKQKREPIEVHFISFYDFPVVANPERD